MIPDEIIEQVANDLQGTSDSIEQSLERLKLDDKYNAEDVEAELDQFIERCGECDWWCEVGELADENGDTQSCDNCRN